MPAMIAIAFHSTGALSKLFSEVNENAYLKRVEGLTSVGGSWGQQMLLGFFRKLHPTTSAMRSCASRSTFALRPLSASSVQAASAMRSRTP